MKMPTIAELKARLKSMGVKGYAKKNKTELMAMLEGSPVPARDRTPVAMSPRGASHLATALNRVLGRGTGGAPPLSDAVSKLREVEAATKARNEARAAAGSGDAHKFHISLDDMRSGRIEGTAEGNKMFSKLSKLYGSDYKARGPIGLLFNEMYDATRHKGPGRILVYKTSDTLAAAAKFLEKHAIFNKDYSIKVYERNDKESGYELLIYSIRKNETPTNADKIAIFYSEHTDDNDRIDRERKILGSSYLPSAYR